MTSKYVAIPELVAFKVEDSGEVQSFFYRMYSNNNDDNNSNNKSIMIFTFHGMFCNQEIWYLMKAF